jgi:hypothetical protein
MGRIVETRRGSGRSGMGWIVGSRRGSGRTTITARTIRSWRARSHATTRTDEPRGECAITIIAEQLAQTRARIVVDALVLGAISRLHCIALGVFFDAQCVVRITALDQKLAHFDLLRRVEIGHARERFGRRCARRSRRWRTRRAMRRGLCLRDTSSEQSSK